MIVSHRHGYVYLACPKTGSSTTQEILRDHYDGKLLLNANGYYMVHNRDIPSRYKELFVFSTVRNPYPRMVSLWWEDTSGELKKHRVRMDGRRRGRRKGDYRKGISYERYVAEVKNPLFRMPLYTWLEYIRSEVQVERQDLFCSQTKFLQLVRLDAIIHLERFNQEFLTLPFVGKLPTFSVIGKAGESLSSKGNYGDYRKHYRNSKVVEKLHDICHEDFKMFGYKMGAI